MEEKIRWKMNTLPKDSPEIRAKQVEFLNHDEALKAKNFHESFPQYTTTPLVGLANLAGQIGLGGIYVKDESYRFGLNAFKVLGGSYAMAKYMCKELGKDIAGMTYTKLISDETRNQLGEVTFVTATDGNHGRGVAWTANKLKQKAIVYMPYGTTPTRLNNILAENADASIKDENYNKCVKMADEYVKTHKGSVLVQDTAWDEYEEIPGHIMQGYGTLSVEAMAQLKEAGVSKPTHVFVQAGVGSLPGAIQGYLASVYGDDGPVFAVVESNLAACLYESAAAGDGKTRMVDGDMQTLMAGLACGEPNITAWNIMKNYSQLFIACPDYISANGMRIFSTPLKGDTRVVSGESGAVCLGLLYEIMTNPEYEALKADLKLDENSNVLLFSTEGDTDPSMYKDIVWRGRNKK